MDINYKAILFDFDGTVMDSERGIMNCAYKTLEGMGLPHTETLDRKKFIGAPIRISIKEGLHIPDHQIEQAVEIYRTNYNETGKYEAELFPGMEELLTELNHAGVILALASAKQEKTLKETVDHFGLGKYFRAVCGAPQGTGITGKKDIILDAVERLGQKKEDCLLVGDSDYDANGAREAGVDFCAAMWGFGFDSEADLAGFTCRYVAKDIPALREFLLRHTCPRR